MTLPTLYKTNARGSTQVINMTIDGPTYTRYWGQEGGKMQEKSTTAKAKNVGRSNETTPEEQAILEAKAVWTKKQDAGYSTSKQPTPSVLLPMKVSVYQDHTNKVTYPCFISPKLDGVNAEYRIVGDELKLFSRGGKEYPIPHHHIDEVKILLETLGTDSINGELYIHGQYLQDIQSAVKKPKDLSSKLVFYVFDFPNIIGDYQTRCEYGYKIVEGLKLKSVAAISVGVARDSIDIEEAFNESVADGYEGLVIRNPKGLYKYNTRSLDVFKYKKAQDGEFEVKSFDIDKNGHPVFHCYINNIHVGTNCTFKVKPKGTNEERLTMASKASSYIGKWLKVEYECLSKSGVPLKPVGITFREVDSNGEALE